VVASAKSQQQQFQHQQQCARSHSPVETPEKASPLASPPTTSPSGAAACPPLAPPPRPPPEGAPVGSSCRNLLDLAAQLNRTTGSSRQLYRTTAVTATPLTQTQQEDSTGRPHRLSGAHSAAKLQMAPLLLQYCNNTPRASSNSPLFFRCCCGTAPLLPAAALLVGQRFLPSLFISSSALVFVPVLEYADILSMRRFTSVHTGT
jgi:hypothetical protein